MNLLIAVENIKCSGCANNIKQTLQAVAGVEGVVVDVELGEVRVSYSSSVESGVLESAIKSKLLSMGYPEVGSVEGLKAAGAKAKSFVSCAIGKMSETK